MDNIRIMLTDDHALVRAGIRSLLNEMKDVEVVAEADNGRDALRLIDKCKPDIVLLDIAMAELNGLETAVRVSKEYPDVKVAILSMHANEEYVVQALRAGAVGYLLKDTAPNELEIAIRAIAMGKVYLSPSISKHVVENYLKRVTSVPQESEPEQSIFNLLTTRQREILQLIAEGNSTKEIAHKLNVSVKTVETHRMQLMERLGINDIAGLVRYAIRQGIISSNK